MIYNELTRRYFEAPPCAGSLSGAQVFRGAAGDPERGTWVQFDLRVEADGLDAVRFTAFGCPHVIAVCAWLAEQAQGTLLTAALPVSVGDLAERFALPVEKLGRLLVVEDAWLAAIAAVTAAATANAATAATTTTAAAATAAIASDTTATASDTDPAGP